MKLTKLKKGEIKAQYANGVAVGKWRDKRDVVFISTEFQPEMVEITNRRGEINKKPEPIVKYNKFMSGVDHQDQMLSYYPCDRKTIRWYKKLGIHFVHMMVLNSFYLFAQSCQHKMNFYDYRLQIIRSLLTPPTKVDKPVTLQHLPQLVSYNAEGTRRARKKCKVCCRKKKRTDTIYMCAACPDSPGLCLEPCFSEFHK